jgi:hypothetical protein
MKKAIICCMLVFILSGCSPLLNKNNISSNNSSVETVSQTEKQTEVVNDSFALKAPILKDVNALDIDTFEIEWSKVEGAAGYVVFCKENTGELKELAETDANSLTYTHENLTNGTTYTYAVKAFKNDNGNKEFSKESNLSDKLCDNNIIDFYQPYRSEKYVEYRGSDTFVMSGEHRNNSFTLTTELSSKDLYADYNLEGKYSEIQFTYGFVDGAYGENDSTSDVCEVTLKVLADDKLIATYDVDSSQLAQTVKLDIANAKKLELYVEKKENWWGEFGFADVHLFK